MRKLKLFSLLAALVCATTTWGISTQFNYCYDCSRLPAYPTVGSSCNLYAFNKPNVGYKGIGFNKDNVPEGPWKLEFVANYDPANDSYEVQTQVNNIISKNSSYYDGVDPSTFPIFRLYQWNPTTSAFEHACYGVVVAYANESNTVEHSSLFISASNDYGCYLTDTEHDGADDFYITFDADNKTGLGALTNPTPTPSTPTPAVDGKLPGAFSVSADKQVYFSQGNLQYNSDTQEWQFAENQYTYVGNDDGVGNQNVTEDGIANNSGIVDLFGWVGASSTWAGLKQYGITSSTATNATDGYGNDESESLKSDWGTLMGTGWFTLSKDQWNYLLNSREPGNSVNGSSNARYTQAAILTDGSGTIGLTYNIHGIILFPDNASLTSVDGVTWGVINAPTQWPSGTRCTTAGWTALQEAGCVFLPAAGFRTYDGTYNCGLYGYYWSSSPYTNPMKETVANAYAMHFLSQTVSPMYDDGARNDGFSVRLVIEAASTPDPTTTISDDASGIEASMAALVAAGGTTDLTINRTLYKDGFFNTLCLPFSLNASELAASPLAGCQLYSLSDATNNGDNLYLTIAEATDIEAGMPYLIKWTSGSDITSMTFTGVTVTASTGSTVTKGNGSSQVKFVGTIGRSTLPAGEENYLFLGSGDNLYYPASGDGTSMKGFRAYFIVGSETSTDIPHQVPARLIIAPKMPTGMDNVQGDNVQSTKVIENGQLYIMYKGTKYNVQGKVVK